MAPVKKSHIIYTIPITRALFTRKWDNSTNGITHITATLIGEIVNPSIGIY
jgi:hypothetical protein